MLTLPDFKQKQIVFAFLSYGEKIRFSNDNLIILDEDGNIKHQSTCYKLFALFVVGHITITSGLLQRSEKFGFSIVLLTHNLRIYTVFGSKTEGNTLLRTKQYKYDSLEIAHRLVENKIYNQQVILKKIRNKNEKIKNAILNLEIYKTKLLENLQLKDLLGVEGISSRVYFSALFQDFNWKRRMPRAKQDITNCLLDIGYTILFNITEAMLNLYGFDIYYGVYHKQFYQRKSLACDLMEPFRPLIDYRIYKAYKLSQIKEEDFDLIQDKYFIFGKKAQPYIKFILEVILKNKIEIFSYFQKYYRAFVAEKGIHLYPYFKIDESS